jgi:hypothetical protein
MMLLAEFHQLVSKKAWIDVGVNPIILLFRADYSALKL